MNYVAIFRCTTNTGVYINIYNYTASYGKQQNKCGAYKIHVLVKLFINTSHCNMLSICTYHALEIPVISQNTRVH